MQSAHEWNSDAMCFFPVGARKYCADFVKADWPSFCFLLGSDDLASGNITVTSSIACTSSQRKLADSCCADVLLEIRYPQISCVKVTDASIYVIINHSIEEDIVGGPREVCVPDPRRVSITFTSAK